MIGLYIVLFMSNGFRVQALEMHYAASSRNERAIILKTYDYDVSEMQCLHRCRMNMKCGSVAFKLHHEKSVGECSLLMGRYVDSESNKDQHVEFKNNEDEKKVIKEVHVYPPLSCREVYLNGERSNGEYFLAPIGWHYCNMDILEGCGLRGWTLAMTMNGSKSTFEFAQDIWTNESTYNEHNGFIDPMNNEAKYHAFSKLPLHSICVGMQIGKVMRYIKIEKEALSLHSLFNSDKYIPTDVGAEKWKKLLPKANLQPKCNLEGFNVRTITTSIRLGITANEEGCRGKWTDSWIGLGGTVLWCDKVKTLTAGNNCCANKYCESKNWLAMAYLYVQ